MEENASTWVGGCASWLNLNLKSLAIKKWATTLLILVRPEQPPPRTKPWGRFCKTWAPGVWPPRRVSS